MALMALMLEVGTSVAQPITTEFNVRIPMRDGVSLSADIYRPAGPGQFPVLLVRTCYLKEDGHRASEEGPWWAARGYAYVIEDVRGRGDSDGVFYPLINEAADGYDTQSWLGAQSWSSGRVGTLGSSYLGWTQVYTAGLNNPHLAAMIPTVTPPDPFRNIPYSHGVFSPVMGDWLAILDGHVMQDLSPVDDRAAYAALPLRDMDLRFGRRLRALRDWVDHPTLDAYWAAQSYQDEYLKTRVPGLHVSGWYDDVLVGTLENYTNLTTRAQNPAVRGQQWMIIGPWGHRINQSQRLGEIDFGAQALIDFRGTEKRWFDHWLTGADNGVEREPHVRLFVMGTNEWRSEAEWPIARTQYTKYFLHSDGKANGLAGGGMLTRTAPAGREPPDRFIYDPADPVPFLSDPGFTQMGGPEDYRQVEHRPDVLVYTTEPYPVSTEICGPLRVSLLAASSARDTDWTAKLLDVHPDGFAQRLNDGIVRARFRHSDSHEEFLVPGKPEAYAIDAWATCIAMQPGHRLRLEISSSAFPKFVPNLNTGGAGGSETLGVKASQTVFHDREHPSYVMVPIVPARP
jgi:putative CocE/NonD family hydrolase